MVTGKPEIIYYLKKQVMANCPEICTCDYDTAQVDHIAPNSSRKVRM